MSGKSKGSPLDIFKKYTGWDSTPKLFRNKYFIGFFGAMMIATIILSDRVDERESYRMLELQDRREKYYEENDRRKLQELLESNPEKADIIKRLYKDESNKD